ncbi:MAG: tRNA uridine-5-carboxymethylaminomethyl(34) synthesis enzyme MnmG [Eubacteriales bacterium]|nr:tRNA uridine-5-carboxymethylaminomethyl(34) synthesis enzyme MnmG [Eubacteriales bacterium]
MSKANYTIETDICVIGAGHAGCEAALACSRLGFRTVIFTMNVDSIAMMPCNPHIGGSSKGHLVREIDALGGEMGKNIDKTFLQSKMLNVSKGPAVHSLRAQADKAAYSQAMRAVLEKQENLTIRQAEVTDILTQPEVEALELFADDSGGHSVFEGDSVSSGNAGFSEPSASSEASGPSRTEKPRVAGVKIHTGMVYLCRAVIVCTGTYLHARCLVGESITETGPGGMQRSTWLRDAMGKLGIPLRRFKTGTPARMDGRTLDYSRMKIQPGDPVVVPFSFSTDPADVQIEQVPCWLTYTNEETHDIIRQNLDRSPIYAGIIEGTGPRYCPSIEDKVVKFSDKIRHHVFIEPEGRFTNEVYVDGMSSSMPDDVQQRMYRTVPGLENCVIVKNAYAIEYDCINANQLKLSLETKAVDGLFCAGQFNGSSGYEEAAAQGLIAGINAVNYLRGREPLILERSEAYIGVLIDDLVTKDNREPYRMMTSRAEYRLLLRQDNADLRLRKYGYEAGLITQKQYDYVLYKEEKIREETERLKKVKIGAAASVREILKSLGSAPLKTACSLAELICRPELSYEKIKELDPDRPALSKDIVEQVEINIRYEGYIERQKKQVRQFEKLEHRKIPSRIDYDDVGSLRNEARQKLKEFLPSSIGQASRISGVTPADITVLLIYLEKNRGNADK